MSGRLTVTIKQRFVDFCRKPTVPKRERGPGAPARGPRWGPRRPRPARKTLGSISSCRLRRSARSGCRVSLRSWRGSARHYSCRSRHWRSKRCGLTRAVWCGAVRCCVCGEGDSSVCRPRAAYRSRSRAPAGGWGALQEMLAPGCHKKLACCWPSPGAYSGPSISSDSRICLLCRARLFSGPSSGDHRDAGPSNCRGRRARRTSCSWWERR